MGDWKILEADGDEPAHAVAELWDGELRVYRGPGGRPEALWIGHCPELTRDWMIARLEARAANIALRIQREAERGDEHLADLRDQEEAVSRELLAVRKGPAIILKETEEPLETTCYLHTTSDPVDQDGKVCAPELAERHLPRTRTIVEALNDAPRLVLEHFGNVRPHFHELIRGEALPAVWPAGPDPF